MSAECEPIKIGVDAHLLSRPFAGIARYTLEMCRALSKFKNISLYLYSPAPILPSLSKLEATVQNRNWGNRILQQYWLEIDLPLWVKKDNVDVFWGPSHRLPKLLPKHTAQVVTIHDLVWKYAKETMRLTTRWSERFQVPSVIQRADQIVTVSHASARAIQKAFSINEKRLIVVTPGVTRNAKKSQLNFDLISDIKQPFFLFVGTLEPRKNLIRLLTAYSHLPKTLKNKILFVIVGRKGWGNEDIKAAILRLGLNNHVRLLGYVEDQALEILYANAQFLAMPSLYEGFGLPLIEAMTQGTPVLTSNRSSMPEVAGKAGLLVNPFDVDSIRKGLEKMITDHKFRNNLAFHAKKNADKFNWDASAKKMLAVFKKAIAIRRGILL